VLVKCSNVARDVHCVCSSKVKMTGFMSCCFYLIFGFLLCVCVYIIFTCLLSVFGSMCCLLVSYFEYNAACCGGTGRQVLPRGELFGVCSRWDSQTDAVLMHTDHIFFVVNMSSLMKKSRRMNLTVCLQMIASFVTDFSK